MDHALKQWVLDAAGRPQVCARVGQIYDELQVQVNQRRPVCLISGRCCRFEEYGHRLYVTTLELAAFVQEWRGRERLAFSPRSEGCPFQVGKMCGVHPIRPLGCRIFFCDATAADWQRDLYERLHASLKRLHEELDVPYAYVEWKSALQTVGLEALLPVVAKTK